MIDQIVLMMGLCREKALEGLNLSGDGLTENAGLLELRNVGLGDPPLIGIDEKDH